MAAYWPGISGIATTPRWDIGAALAIPLFFAPRLRMTAASVFGLLLVGFLILSLSWSEGWRDGVDQALKITVIAGAFAYGMTLDHLDGFLKGAACGLMVSLGVVVLQAFGSDWFPFHLRPAGLFFNPDYMAEVTACVIAIALWRLPLWWSLVLVPLVVVSEARGAILALAVTGIAMLGRQPLRIKAALLAGVMGLVAISVHRGVGIQTRLDLWRDTISGLTVWGHGLGSFWETFPHYAHAADISTWRPEHPHNEALWLTYEGGVVGVILGLGFCVALVWNIRGPSRAILAVVGIEALFGMPLHDPATALFVACCAGHLSRDGGCVRDLAVACRLALRPRLAAALARNRA